MLMVEAPTEHLAVLGQPIAHSRSPLIHAAAYAELGLAWHFNRFEVAEPELMGFLNERLSNYRGFAVTMPLKKEAHRIASILDPVATVSGVVNTLLRLDSERQPWAGFNTDVPGLVAALRRAELNVGHTVVLGAGATAVSAVLAAHNLGAESVTVVARRPEASAELASLFAERLAAAETPTRLYATTIDDLATQTTDAQRTQKTQPTLCISTLPGSAGAQLTIAEALLQAPLFDVAYDPWPSQLASRWRGAGQQAHSGMSMLIEQAIVQIRIFVNGEPSVELEREERVRDAMYAAVTGMGD